MQSGVARCLWDVSESGRLRGGMYYILASTHCVFMVLTWNGLHPTLHIFNLPSLHLNTIIPFDNI